MSKTYAPLKALAMASTLALLALAVGACASTPPIVTVQSACSSLVPGELRADVPGVEPYSETPTVGDLIVFGDGQTAALDTANRNKRAQLAVIELCERRDKETAKALRPRRFFGIF
jgi:hypothetical protein